MAPGSPSDRIDDSDSCRVSIDARRSEPAARFVYCTKRLASSKTSSPVDLRTACAPALSAVHLKF